LVVEPVILVALPSTLNAVPWPVKLPLKVTDLPSAIDSVAPLVTGVMVTLLIEPAMASPIFGVIRLGEVCRTVAPTPVVGPVIPVTGAD
jgi:hypothetical protein